LLVAPLGERAETRAFRLARELRRGGVRLEIEPGRKSLKSHLRRADKLGAAFALIVGDDELTRGTGILRNLGNQSQVEMPLDAAAILAAVRADRPGGSF
jgi:histidyl-tRNA synthetase